MSNKRVREMLKLRRMEHDRKVAEARIPVINAVPLMEEKEEPVEKEEPKEEKKPAKKRGRPNKKKESE